ncbi:Mbov_0392 family ICE element protein [[Mycoplasma] collis]|uniref:Mbov_0392 family ICE element protein n=1 Tax=[Mycoplasma] collis TaxID=2127 RepID=UPI00051B5D9C|nr:hypothetical protein [[Mycoplasma] collis]
MEKLDLIEYYKNLNPYSFKFDEWKKYIFERLKNSSYDFENEIKEKLANDIMKVETKEILNYFENKKLDNDLGLYLKENQIYQFDALWKKVDKSIKDFGMISHLIYLAEPLQTAPMYLTINNSLVKVNSSFNDFKEVKQEEIIQTYIKDELNDDQLIELHQFTKNLEKQKQQEQEAEMEM